MFKYTLKPGDLIINFPKTGFVIKTTKKYLYYILPGCSFYLRTSKKKLWRNIDTNGDYKVKYGNMKHRRKQRKMRTLDLHGVAQRDVEETVKSFLNFIELPCVVITGNSSSMRHHVEEIVSEYGWYARQESAHNPGALVVYEKNKDPQ